MDPLFNISSYDEAVRGDSSQPRKRLKISNLLDSPVEHKPQGLKHEEFHNYASDSHSSDHSNTSDLFKTGASTPGLEESPDNVCYGMLHNIEVQLKWLPKEYSPVAALFGDLSLILATLDFDTDPSVTFVRTEDGQPIGVTSVLTSSGLRQLKDQCSTKLQLWVPERSWVASMESLSKKNRKGEAVRLLTDIVVSGDGSEGRSVAKGLSSCGLYLQDPYQELIDGPYANPQSLPFPLSLDSSFQSFNAQQDPDIHSGEGLDDNEPMYNGDLKETDLLQALDSFFEEIPTQEYSASKPSSVRIWSTLYSHQRTAMDFIRRRESGAMPVERSMWQPYQLSNFDSCFQHSITGEKGPSNPDTAGGILADETGLGKTLSILSAIVDSMADAQDFSNRGEKDNVISTLVIVPSELLLWSWVDEIRKHIMPGDLSFLIYHGQGREAYDATIGEHHLVLTTYGTVVVESKRRGALFLKNWYRIVLDEAHTIRNPSSKQFQAVTGLSSQCRWCVTGTPIQHSLKDLESLVRFLRVPVFEKSSNFHKYITKSRPKNLRILLRSIALRRRIIAIAGTKPIYVDRRPVFTPKERTQYEDLLLSYNRFITLALKTQSHSSDGLRVTQAILRLRMFCNNGLEEQSNNTRRGHPSSMADETLRILKQANEAICAYCTSPVDSASRLPDEDLCFLTVCLRLVCPTCMPEHRKAQEDTRSGSCPLCGHKHSFQEQNLESGIQTGQKRNSLPTKIVMLVEDVYEHYLRSKCVVFSCWKRSLDIVSSALTEKGIQHLRVDGDITARLRNRVLKDFQIRSDVNVLLMTLSTGAVGLNGLTVANQIYILEPQWNPTVEAQAIGRVVRLGQEKNVTVIRYAMTDSIEEFVRKQQHFKLKVGEAGFTSDEDLEHVDTPRVEELIDTSMLIQ